MTGEIVGPRSGVLTISATSYKLSAQHNKLTLVFTSGSPIAFLIPVGLPNGIRVKIVRDGAGLITFSTESGVSLNNLNSQTTSGAQYAVLDLEAIGTDNYVLSGDVAGGGGGGASIQPETGSSPIKISAFPDASGAMGSTDTVTGLQGGANVNWTQVQLLSGPQGHSLYLRAASATSGNTTGDSAEVTGGNGFGSGAGGPSGVQAGTAGITGVGGQVYLKAGIGGTTSGNGGPAKVYGGDAPTLGNGGTIFLYGGNGAGAGKVSGSVSIRPGYTGGGSTYGFVYVNHLPTVDPHKVGALWKKSTAPFTMYVSNG